LLFDDFNSKHRSLVERQRLIGIKGEKVALTYLKRSGWRCVATNVRFGKDELDILAMTPDEGTLVIVEVRATGVETKKPERTVGKSKRSAMMRIAKQLRGCARRNSSTLRVDLITVSFAKKPVTIEHYRGVLRIGASRIFT
jgi:putative endonuclease